MSLQALRTFVVIAHTAGGSQLDCHAVSAAADDKWCDLNCNYSPPNCPANLCQCDAPAPTPPPTPMPPPSPAPSPPTPSPVPTPPPGSIMRGAWLAPGGVGKYPGGYDLVAHFAGEPNWARAHYHGPGMNSIPAFPGDGSEKYKFFTVCGDSCVFNAGFMASYLAGTSWQEMCSELKAKGYNGIMYDWEIFEYAWSDADNAALNDAFRETKACGMYSAWTTAAMGPYEDTAGGVIDIDWTQLDFAMPQMYDAHQSYYQNGLETYAPWWKNGGVSIHKWTLASGVGPNTIVLWGASTQSSGVDSGIGPKTAKAAMAITGLPGGFIEWTYDCAYPCFMSNATLV